MPHDPPGAGSVEGVELLSVTHPTCAFRSLVPLVTAHGTRRADLADVHPGRFVITVTPVEINRVAGPGVIVPSRETPVAERTMCDDVNDAP
ncbi:hypothetical protein GCM10009848_38860 [Micromonospora lupini]